MGEIWLSAVIVGLGGLLMAATLMFALFHTVDVGSRAHWTRRHDRLSFIAFAWSELGRGLFYGYLMALGMSPLTAFFFLGQDGFWFNFIVLTALMWGLSASLIYFWTVLCGVVGFVRYQQRAHELGSLNAFTQFLVVIAMSAPLAFILVKFLLPPADQVFTILVETMKFHLARTMI